MQAIREHLTAIQNRDMAEFVANVDWRAYLEADLGQLWREQEPKKNQYYHEIGVSHYERVEELPSGALVIWGNEGYNPEIVREALHALSAGVEVADHVPILQE